jgi:hypothetical protein
MKQVSLLIIAGLILLQCKGNKPSHDAVPTSGQVTLKKTEVSAAESNRQESDAASKTLHLTASIDSPEADAPKPFDVDLRYTAEGRITGKARLEESALDLHGVLDDGYFRVWVWGNVGDEKRVRRGYLIGEIKDDTVTGTFAISGNAGIPSYRGRLRRK